LTTLVWLGEEHENPTSQYEKSSDISPFRMEMSYWSKPLVYYLL